MFNYKLNLEYNGADFSGSQVQNEDGNPSARTVQSELEAGLTKFFKSPIKTTFAGRTDAGVHAIGQVINFKLEQELPDILNNNPDKTLLSLNAQLPASMALTSIEAVEEDFDARFNAIARAYMYKIFIRKHRPVLRTDSLMWQKEELIFDLMQNHAQSLLGTHDFSAYAKINDNENSECKIFRSELVKESEICYKYYIKANRFLRHMVRRLVGELIQVGRGIEAGPETKNLSVPAEGLTLMKVYY